MNKYVSLVLIGLFLVTVSSVLADETGRSGEFRSIDGNIVYASPMGGTIPLTVIEFATLPENAQMKDWVKDVLDSFSVIPLTQGVVTINDAGSANIHLNFDSFEYNGMAFATYMPSGITLRVTSQVKYDINLLINREHIRVEGMFLSEDALLTTIASIVEEPGTYLQSRDPEYILRTFQDLNAAIASLELALEEQKLAAAEELEAMTSAFQEELDDFRYANFIAENRNLFGSYRLVDRDVVEWIVETKEANPALTADEIAEMQAAEPAIADQQLKAKVIQLIIGLYFNDYPVD